MGNAIKSFAKGVAKAAISGAGSAIPIIGGPLASWVNSKFAVGSFDIGAPGVDIPEDAKKKMITTPAQLKALVKAEPGVAAKAGLTVEMIDQEVKKAKEEAKAIGGMVGMGRKVSTMVPRVGIPPATEFSKPAMAVGGKVKGKGMKPEEMERLHSGIEEGKAPKAKAFAVGTPKVKKPRTAAQIAATKKLVEANRARRAKKE